MRIIFVGSEIQKYEWDLIRVGVSPESLDAINQAMIAALSSTRKHALGLIEVFEIKDEALHSILGRRDREVYSHMLVSTIDVDMISVRISSFRASPMLSNENLIQLLSRNT